MNKRQKKKDFKSKHQGFSKEQHFYKGFCSSCNTHLILLDGHLTQCPTDGCGGGTLVQRIES